MTSPRQSSADPKHRCKGSSPDHCKKPVSRSVTRKVVALLGRLPLTEAVIRPRRIGRRASGRTQRAGGGFWYAGIWPRDEEGGCRALNLAAAGFRTDKASRKVVGMAGDRVSDRGRARHEIPIPATRYQSRLTWCTAGRCRSAYDDNCRPSHRLVAGQLSAVDIQVVSEWIWLNEAALAHYWDGRIYTNELAQRLQRLP
jgi:hypothetical protein